MRDADPQISHHHLESKRMAKKTKSLKEYLEVGNISAELVLKNFPFVLFIGFLLIAYIANAHYSEKKVRQIQKLQSDVKELRWEYMSIKANLMFSTMQTEVVKAVEPIGLKPINGKPKKIIVSKNKIQ